MSLPSIIQGGMGLGVSDWNLAKSVSLCGQLGVVSGSAIDTIMIRRLQNGDPGGHVRRALENFPFVEYAQSVIEKYFRAEPDEGDQKQPYRLLPKYTLQPSLERMRITVIANFVEVFLAKEGHSGLVGINLLSKVQMPTLPSLYGAMMAGVDYVLMGAGIPRYVPGCLDRMAQSESAEMPIDIAQEGRSEKATFSFEPKALFESAADSLKRPQFLPIVSSVVLAKTLLKKSNGEVDGFIVERHVAGGHNAPPRNGSPQTPEGDPAYGEKDEVNLEQLSSLGKPFWLAGMRAEPELYREALKYGAAGVQVGTAFAYSNESGLKKEWKEKVFEKIRNGGVTVKTDFKVSPTQFPFKVVEMEGTLSDETVFQDRKRVCDLGYLSQPYKTAEGRLVYRCAAAPEGSFVRKGGDIEECTGRKCLCNGLLATIGLGQKQKGDQDEPAILTASDDLNGLLRYLKPGANSYSASDVIDHILGKG